MVLAMSFVVTAALVGYGIYYVKQQEQQNETRAFHNAIKSTEPLVLQNFLDMYAEAPKAHRDSALAMIKSLQQVDADWLKALQSNTSYAFERFLRQHPQSIYTAEADIKIDSLDWIAALSKNSTEAIQAYLEKHNDGAYYDEAHQRLEQIEAQHLTNEERQMVIQLFTQFFNALALMDEAAIEASVAPVMTSFLHRQGATQNDVCLYMKKMHEGNIAKMVFTPHGDWTIEKYAVEPERYAYKAEFSMAQHCEHSDDASTSSMLYKIKAEADSQGRITELNMKRSIME